MNLSKIVKDSNNYNVLLIALLTAALVGITGWFGYSWYVKHYEEKAQLDLTEGLEEYFKKLNGVDSTRTWEDLERAFVQAAKSHSKSKLYPYFLALQADVLAQAGKQEQTVNIMNKAINSMDHNQPIFYLYQAKQALLKLDNQDAKIQNEGREELIKLSQQKDSPVYSMVLYYLGLDAETQGKMNEAKKYFNEIIAAKDNNWSAMAQEKL